MVTGSTNSVAVRMHLTKEPFSMPTTPTLLSAAVRDKQVPTEMIAVNIKTTYSMVFRNNETVYTLGITNT